MAKKDETPLGEKEANDIMSKVLTELRKSTAKTVKGQTEAMKKFTDKLDNIEGLTDAQQSRAKRAAMLEQSLNFDKASAMDVARTTEALEILNQRISDLKQLGEETGQARQASFQAEMENLNLQRVSLQEQQMYGRNLGAFEKKFVTFAGSTFEEMRKSIEEGGSRTSSAINKDLAQSLSSDFDRILSFFGPMGSIIQQIPFLGSIFTYLRAWGAKAITHMALSAKRWLSDRKQKKKVDKQNLHYQKKQLTAQERQTRKLKKDGTADMRYKDNKQDVEEAASEGPKMGDSFRGAAIFLAAAAATGKIAGVGLTAAAAGMSAFATSAFKFAGALAVGGLALGVGLTGVFGAFALGEKMGAFEGMAAFGKVNMLKVLGSMLGLATLMGVLGSIVTSGVGALIMGVGALAVMAMIGVLVVIGKGLGSFAESVMPFEEMNIPRIKTNIQQLAGISGDIGELLKLRKGWTFGSMMSDHPLEELANALMKYQHDMTLPIQNIENLKIALAGFEFPELPDGEKGGLFSGDLLRGWTGEDFSGELKKLSKLTIAMSLGEKLGKLGDGIGKIGVGLGSITDKKVKHLEALTEALDDMKSVTLNFGAAAVATPVLKGMQDGSGQNNITQVNTPVVNNTTNVARSQRFAARGSNMGNHSALHYASLP